MLNYAPVVIFVYNRYEHTERLLNSLEQCRLFDDTPVYIFCDYAKKEGAIENMNKTREVVDKFAVKYKNKEITIVKADKNKGLAKSIIDGVSYVFDKYTSVIVLEDDLILSKNFLEYTNNALSFYEKDEKIWSISGFSMPMNSLNKYKHDVYFTGRGCSWGWATWKNRWQQVDWSVADYRLFRKSIFKRLKFGKWGVDMPTMLDSQMKGEINSWAIRWCYSEYKHNMFTVYPKYSLVKNSGCDGSGTHCGRTDCFETTLVDDNYEFNLTKPIFSKKIQREFKCNQFSAFGRKYTIKKSIYYFMKNTNLDRLYHIIKR